MAFSYSETGSESLYAYLKGKSDAGVESLACLVNYGRFPAEFVTVSSHIEFCVVTLMSRYAANSHSRMHHSAQTVT